MYRSILLALFVCCLSACARNYNAGPTINDGMDPRNTNTAATSAATMIAPLQ